MGELAEQVRGELEGRQENGNRFPQRLAQRARQSGCAGWLLALALASAGAGYLIHNTWAGKKEKEAEKPRVGIEVVAEPEPKKDIALEAPSVARVAPRPVGSPVEEKDPQSIGSNQFHNKGWSGHEINPRLWYLEGSDGQFYVCGQPMPKGVVNVGYAQHGQEIRKKYLPPAEAVIEAPQRRVSIDDIYSRVKKIENKLEAPAEPASEPVKEPEKAEPSKAEAAKPAELGELVLTISPKQATEYVLNPREPFKVLYLRKSPDDKKKEFGEYYLHVVFPDGSEKDIDIKEDKAEELKKKLGYE